MVHYSQLCPRRIWVAGEKTATNDGNGSEKKGSKSIVVEFVPSRHFVWHQNPWIMGVGVPNNVVDAPPTGPCPPCSEKGCIIGWRVDLTRARVLRRYTDAFHISCSFALHSIATAIPIQYCLRHCLNIIVII